MTLGVESARWPGFPECPCDDPRCVEVGLKLTRRGHVRGCVCISCRNRRNQKTGKRGQANMHRALGGTGFTPSNEESARPYHLELVTMPEVKKGAQVPINFSRFITGKWFADAMSQSRRAAPIGSNAMPAVYLEPPGGGRYLVVEVEPRRRKRL